MHSKIEQALTRKFEGHRIVFWYDTNSDFQEEFDSFKVKGVEKIKISNNEFSIKHRILREEPKGKFLIFKDGPAPEPSENWLLDVQLSHDVFSSDQADIWGADVGLGPEFGKFIRKHLDFFRSEKRRSDLTSLLESNDSEPRIRLAMLAVATGAESRVDSILESLLKDLSDGREDKFRQIQRFALEDFLWERVNRVYGYESKDPSVHDFAIELFKSCFAMETGGSPSLKNEALVFLNRWKDSRRHHKSFEGLSADFADVLGIESNLQNQDFRDLLIVDFFSVIDRKIISDMVAAIATRTVTHGDVEVWIRQRRQCHWFSQFEDVYRALENASNFLQLLSEVNLEFDSLTEFVNAYADSIYEVDQLYRKFIYHVRESSQPTLLNELLDLIENNYSNNFLLPLNDNLQAHIDKLEKWDVPGSTMQRRFFARHVKSLASKGKVCVIISDAMRYEVGEELARNIRSSNKYDVDLSHAVSSVPSYTQLGMAALLPNKELTLMADDAQVLSDNKRTNSLAARAKVLKSAFENSEALMAGTVLEMQRDEIRELCRNNQVVYVYHDYIDFTGDKIKTQDRVFNACETTIEELLRVVTKLGGENYISQFLITADHGFIYQNRELHESDFCDDKPEGDEGMFVNRRFVIGKGLRVQPALKKFTSDQLGLSGDLEVQIPKSINRLRVKGSGSKFVHGGAALQEILIPVLEIKKKRASDVSKVEVEILTGSTSVISSGQLAVVFYQSNPATDKRKPRELRAGIYTADDELISDSHEITFDLTSDNPREREIRVRFVLSRKADEVNNKEVYLRLEERHGKTTHFVLYKSAIYRIQRSFTSDFDL